MDSNLFNKHSEEFYSKNFLRFNHPNRLSKNSKPPKVKKFKYNLEKQGGH